MQALIGGFCLDQGPLRRHRDKAIEFFIEPFDPGEIDLRQFLA